MKATGAPFSGLLQGQQHFVVPLFQRPYTWKEEDWRALFDDVMEVYGELEAIRISDRTKAGLERARAQGKILGRPDGFERWCPEIERMLGEGYAKKKMARETGLSYNTVKGYLARLDAEAAGAEGRAEIVVSPGDGGPPTVAEAKVSHKTEGER